MKKALLMIAATGMLTLVSFTTTKNLNTKLNLKDSGIVWTGSKITGGKHTGTLEFKDINLNFNDGQLSGGSIRVDMTTLKNTDLEGEWSNKLVGHLTSEDFFSTAKFPTSVLKITSVKKGSSNNKLNVEAELTIKDKTLIEKFVVTVQQQGSQVTLTTTLKIDRTKYGVKYNSTNFFENLGDKAIDDLFTLEVKIVTTSK